MVVISKQLYNDACRDIPCNVLFHPWQRNCISAFPQLFLEACQGSVKFYILVYLAQTAIQGKKLKQKKTWYKLGDNFVRSVALGVISACSFVNINCFLRNIIGIQSTYISSLVLPFVLNGLAIYMEPPNRRGLVINLFVNLLIEYWVNCLSGGGYLEVTKAKRVLSFMVGSGLLFYLMRLEGRKEKRTALFWLYTAEKVKEEKDPDGNVCPHQGSCLQHIAKGYSRYFFIGLGISLAKLILPRIKTPYQAISSLRWKHLRLALFFGSYIGIYRSIICYLCRKRRKDSELYALPAGCIAGLSMIFNPSTSLAIAAATGAMKLYSTILYERQILPQNIPIPEMLFCVCQGVLFPARFVNLDLTPAHIVNLIDKVSYNNSLRLYNFVIERMNKM